MFKIHVPSTTANLGPGFDALGMALSLYSEFECEKSDSIKIEVCGVESEKIDIEKNLVVDSMNYLFEYVGRRPEGFFLKINNKIPMARGLGSSAAAIVGGLISANLLLDSPLDDGEILKLATDIEGHPDNVVPAYLGNLVISTQTEDKEVVFRKITPFEDLTCVVFVPEYEVSTSESRKVLPESFSMKDAVHNASHLGLLMVGFMTADKALIGQAMNDRIHEPYRKSLIKNFDEFKSTSLESGAFSFSLSGSGSTVIAYCEDEYADKVRDSFEKLAEEKNIEGSALVLKPCKNGARIEK